MNLLTLVDFHVGDGLPLIHGNKPPVLAAVPAAAEVNHQLVLVAAEGFKYGIQTGLRKGPSGEEEGGDDDLNKRGDGRGRRGT